MPRGVKGSGKSKTIKSIDDQIAEIDSFINSLQTKLSGAKAKRKELFELKKKSEIDAIQKIMKECGLTTQQLKKLIESKS